MRPFDIIAVLIGLSAVFSWLNDRFLRLPSAIGLMLVAMLFSLALHLPLPFAPHLQEQVGTMLRSIDLTEVLLHGMLGLLLFAGALHVDLRELAKQKWVVLTLASASVLGATLLIGIDSYLLFWAIGLEVLVIDVSRELLIAGLLSIPLVLAARLASVATPVRLMRRSRGFEPGVVSILTWGGLRGGISVALVLSLPEGPIADVLLTVTYIVVVFSVLVQGLTLGPVVRRAARTPAAAQDASGGALNAASQVPGAIPCRAAMHAPLSVLFPGVEPSPMPNAVGARRVHPAPRNGPRPWALSAY